MKKVLIVDDMSMIRIYLRHILSSMDFEVFEAGNGLEGLEQAWKKQFDLMFVDINMPQMDGYTMVQALRKEESTRKVPVIIISTESDDIDKMQGYQSGANFYLTKPIKPESVRVIASMLC